METAKRIGTRTRDQDNRTLNDLLKTTGRFSYTIRLQFQLIEESNTVIASSYSCHQFFPVMQISLFHSTFIIIQF